MKSGALCYIPANFDLRALCNQPPPRTAVCTKIETTTFLSITFVLLSCCAALHCCDLHHHKLLPTSHQTCKEIHVRVLCEFTLPHTSLCRTLHFTALCPRLCLLPI